jgi:hypothetical protein
LSGALVVPILLADVALKAHYGLKSDIVPGPKSADTVAKVESCNGLNFWRELEA